MNEPQHPDWGSWGGRYGSIGPALGLWTDTQDRAIGVDGTEVAGNKVSIWRWRTEFQNDFAARISWTLTDDYRTANHNPVLVLNSIAGRTPLQIESCADRPIKLSAAGTSDPDGNGLSYRWWQYREAGNGLNPQQLDISMTGPDEATIVAPVTVKPAPNVDIHPMAIYHVVLSVTDDGQPPLTSYRRVLLTVPTVGTAASDRLHCQPTSAQ